MFPHPVFYYNTIIYMFLQTHTHTHARTNYGFAPTKSRATPRNISGRLYILIENKVLVSSFRELTHCYALLYVRCATVS